MTDTLLPPEEAQRLLEDGSAPTAEIIAHLDLEKCSFGKRVVTDTLPVVRTSMLPLSEPASGHPAFSSGDIESHSAQGLPSLFVTAHGSSNRAGMRTLPAGVLYLAADEQDHYRIVAGHFFTELRQKYESVLIDRSDPAEMRLSEKADSVVLKDGRRIDKGGCITIEPETGRVWLGKQPIEESPLSVSMFSRAAQSVTAKTGSRVVFHASYQSDLASLRRMKLDWPSRSIGLFRREGAWREGLRASKDDILSFLGTKAWPLKMSSRDGFVLRQEFPTYYRFPDMQGLFPVLPLWAQSELKAGQEAIVGTKSFELRKNLYGFCVARTFETIAKKILKVSKWRSSLDVVLPNVANPDEVKHLFAAIDEVTPCEIAPLIKRGVMIENKEILRYPHEIGAMCDSLCLGWGDMTASLLGVDRADASNRANEVLLPEVVGPVAAFVRSARAVNPHLKINACGHQTSWGHVPSLRLLLRAIPEIDMITVYPSLPIATLTQLAIAQHHARRQLGLPLL